MPLDSARPVWLITGASRGFGLELARQALDRGDRVVATARDVTQVTAQLGEHDRLLALPLDVTDSTAAHGAAARAVERFGRIDVLVNNAGNGLIGALEELSDAELRALFDVNVFGLAEVTRAVLPVMRRQRSGRILNLSSVAGFVGTAGWGGYAATKFAVEALSESLRGELEPLGIHVTIVEPGGFRTDFLNASSLRLAARRLEDYDETAGAARQWGADNDHAQVGDPARAAAAMLALADAPAPPLRLALGRDSVEAIEAKLDGVRAELDAWRELSVSSDLVDVAPARR